MANSDLISCKAAVICEEEVHLRVAEHADLRVYIAQVRNLDDLGDPLEAPVAPSAEEALGRIDHVAAVAVERGPADYRNVDAVSGTRTEVEVFATLLRHRQRVVEPGRRSGC